LKLDDTEAPVIDNGCQEETFTITNRSNCSAFVTTSATATDCHAPEDLDWNYVIKDVDDVTVNAGTTNQINSNLEIGTYDVTWIVADKCGNRDTCMKMITIVDGVAPVIECRNRTLSLDANGMLTVTPQEFIATASDNCSAQEDITYAFQSATGDMSQDFTCTNLGGQEFRDFTLQVFAIDAAGNASSCNVTLTINNDNGGCDTNVGMAAIAGEVFTESDFTIDQAQVTVQRMTSGEETSMMTPLEGEYSFSNLSMFDNYEVSAKREDAYLNGVSTLDIVMIQQHILGLRDLPTAYKVIAADVDGSGSVAGSDLVHLRKLVLGRSLELPIGQPWTFVDASQTWSDEVKPFPYNQTIEIEDLENDMAGLDFIGVKMGDVNGNVELQSSLLGIKRSTEGLRVNTVDREGEEVIIGMTPITATPIMGMQVALSYDVTQSQVLGVISDVVEISDDNYSIVDGEIRISWHSIAPVELDGDLPLFEIVMRTSSNEDTEGLIVISEEMMAAEIYKTTGAEIEVSDLFLEHETADIAVTDIMEVMQNTPNPWQESTTISFYQPQAGSMKMSVYDLTGKQILRVTDNYEKGWNRTSLTKDQLPGAGVYVYEMTDGVSVIRKKMIIVE